MNLSKAFDTTNLSLLGAKFMVSYGFSTGFLKLWFQRTKVNGSFSDWTQILARFPQGSFLRPLLFNIFLNDFFLFVTNSNLCHDADEHTPSKYTIDKNLYVVKFNLETNFYYAEMVLWESYCCLILENAIIC